jgi:colanic acid biosynthesis glycosyl transferase WcaI
MLVNAIPSRPRVLIVGLNYAPEPTGIAPYTAGLASGLAREGYDVEVLTAFPHYPHWRVHDGYHGLSHREVISGVNIRRLRHYIPHGTSGILRAISEFSFGVRLVCSRWGSAEVVICVSPALISSAMAIARVRLGRKRPAIGLVVQDLYSVGVAEIRGAGLFSRIISKVEAWSAKRVDGVSVIHERFRNRISSALGVADDSISVVRNWTHVEAVADFDRSDFRRKMMWDDRQVILHAGAMGEKQALENVIEAARHAEENAWNLHFVLMGDGKQRQCLEARARGISSVEFLDPLPQVQYGQAMRSADALLVNERPGVLEMAVPSKLTSYFSTGVPVLAATAPSSTTAEEVAASGAGVCVVSGNPVRLAEAAKELCSDKGRAAALGSAGPRYCSDVLSEEQAIDGYEAWIRDLMVRARARRGEA